MNERKGWRHWMLIEDFIEGDPVEKTIFVFVGLVFVSVIALVVGLVIHLTFPGETFTLRSDQWRCVASHIESTTSVVPVGKVFVPITSTGSVCDQYNRR